MRTSIINIDSVKDSDGWMEVANDIGLSEEETYKVFEYGEYASFSLIVDENLNITGGHITPHKSDWRDKNEN